MSDHPERRSVSGPSESGERPAGDSPRRSPNQDAKGLAIAGLTTVCVAIAAAYSSSVASDPSVAMTAWICAAVVGSSTMISASKRS